MCISHIFDCVIKIFNKKFIFAYINLPPIIYITNLNIKIIINVQFSIT